MTAVDVFALREAVGLRDLAAADAARARLDSLVKPEGSLGRLEQLAAWLAGAQGVCPPRPLDRVRVVVFAGEVTAARARALVAGAAGINVLARLNGATVRVVHLSVDADLTDDPTTDTAPRGSASIDREDALTSDELNAAFGAGMAIADEEVDAGADLLVPGDLGIGNATIAAALVGAALGLGPLDVIGSGAGVDDAAWAREARVLRDALYRAQGLQPDPLGILRTVGSADTAAMTGFLVQAAVRRTPVLLDGVVSCACALIARRVAEDAAQWWLAGHRSTQPAQRLALDVLGLTPLIDLGMRLGEGTGALTALPLLRAAQALLAEMATLESLHLPAQIDPETT